MFVSILAAALTVSSPQTDQQCDMIPGWEDLIADQDPRYIVFGEVHGTEEMPAIFADAVCLAAQAQPVVVALEVPDRDQPLIDAFLQSDGGVHAQHALLQTLWFQNTFKDGRSSNAMLALVEALRQMYQAGSITGVTAFQYVGGRGGLSSAEYEQTLAQLIVSAPIEEERVLVLVGNTHARSTEVTFGDRTYMPMAGHLPRDRTLSILIVDNGGDSWNCTGNPVICGASGWSGPDDPYERGISLSDDPESPWDARLYLGSRTTASLPAE